MLVTSPTWRKTKSQLYPWVNTLDRIFSASPLPTLSGSTLMLVSDCAGEHHSCRYEVFTVLAFDHDSAAQWNHMRQTIRLNALKDNRRMSFKNLNDLRRRQALRPLLCAANSISGVCATFIVDKRVKLLCTTAGTAVSEFGLQGRWGIHAFDRMARQAHFVSVLIAGLSQPSQNVFWISDESDVFANPGRCRDATHLTSCFTNYYVGHKLGELGIGTTQMDDTNLLLEDLAAIPDLVAGAMAALTTKIAATYGGHIPHGLALSVPRSLPPKVEHIVDWLTESKQPLSKVSVTFDLTDSGQLAVFRFELA